MGMHLDLDDVSAGHPLAMAELAELRAEIERLRKIAHSDDGAGGDGMRLYLEHREMRSLLERIVRNPENVSHATGLREDLMAWAKKTLNA